MSACYVTLQIIGICLLSEYDKDEHAKNSERTSLLVNEVVDTEGVSEEDNEKTPLKNQGDLNEMNNLGVKLEI
jgi:hypothetical protein